MRKRTSAKLRAVAVLSVAAAGLTASVISGPSAVAADHSAAPQLAQSDCQIVNIGSTLGRTVYKWNCNGRFHGQIANASHNDLVYLKFPSGDGFAGNRVKNGETSADTAGDAENRLVSACISIHDRPGSDICVS